MPGTDELWAVVNNRDNILVPDDRDADGDGKGDRGKHVDAYVDDHPPEPFIRVRQDGNYGWPFCNPSPDKGLRNMPYDRDYQFNRDGRALDCATATPVDVGIQAHSAPLGLTFTQDTAAPDVGAVVALHGSWNRTRPTGYKVIHFPWTADGPGEQADLVTGFQEGTADPWARPVDVAVERERFPAGQRRPRRRRHPAHAAVTLNGSCSARSLSSRAWSTRLTTSVTSCWSRTTFASVMDDVTT